MGRILGADVWGLRPLARAERAALPDGLTLNVEMLRLAIMFRRSGHRQIKKTLETGMAGEIREQMAALRAAKQKMISDISAEIASVAQEVHETKSDALDALQLPRAEIGAYRQEIREIRQEFAPATNGGPPGPLPGTSEATSSGSSAASASSAAPDSTSPDAYRVPVTS